MTTNKSRNRNRPFAVPTLLAVTSIAALVGVFTAYAQNGSAYFYPGNLVVSRSIYVNANNIQAGTTILPPNCSLANCPAPVTAVVDSTYPFVWNNDTVDGSFGITSTIFLDQITPSGTLVTSLEVPNSSQNGVPPRNGISLGTGHRRAAQHHGRRGWRCRDHLRHHLHH